jgi:hypothetical protein
MELTEQQKDVVRQWVASGASLSEVQKRLGAELGISMTYMDVRFLVLDLGVSVKDKPRQAPAPAKAAAAVPAESADGLGALDEEEALPEEMPPAAGAGHVKVELDRITKAGAVISGTVTFSDGVSAAWSLDQFGRLGLGAKPGYQPSREDIQAFQGELQRLLSRQGY